MVLKKHRNRERERGGGGHKEVNMNKIIQTLQTESYLESQDLLIAIFNCNQFYIWLNIYCFILLWNVSNQKMCESASINYRSTARKVVRHSNHKIRDLEPSRFQNHRIMPAMQKRKFACNDQCVFIT